MVVTDLRYEEQKAVMHLLEGLRVEVLGLQPAPGDLVVKFVEMRLQSLMLELKSYPSRLHRYLGREEWCAFCGKPPGAHLR